MPAKFFKSDQKFNSPEIRQIKIKDTQRAHVITP